MKHTPEATKIDIKQCVECYAKLPASDFSLHRAMPDGRQPMCSLCSKEYQSFRYAAKHGRVAASPTSEIVRSVRLHNSTLIQHALTEADPNTTFTCHAFVPHQPAIYEVSFGPHAFGRCMTIRELAECGGPFDPTETPREYYYRLFVYSRKDQPYIAGSLLSILKEKRLRLEFSEADLLNSQSTIYYIE